MAYAQLTATAIGSVITYLEMKERPTGHVPGGSTFRLVRMEKPKVDDYRSLFRKVGCNWLWFERLTLTNRDLRLLIHDQDMEIYAVVDEAGAEVGMIELDFRTAGICNLAYLGFVPELTGQGHGRWLLDAALEHAWRDGTRKVTVNTCTLDHPAALPAYRRAGFVVTGRAVGTFIDPRLCGILPREAAPHIPFVESDGAEA